MLQMGDLVDGKYRILRKCGQGGMSVVYMAVNERANKTWAIKEVRKDGSWNFQVVKQGLLTGRFGMDDQLPAAPFSLLWIILRDVL